MGNFFIYAYVLLWPLFNQYVILNLGVGIPDITFQLIILPTMFLVVFLREHRVVYGSFFIWLLVFVLFCISTLFINRVPNITGILQSIATSFIFPYMMYFILINSRKTLNYKWLGISVIVGAMIIASIGIVEFGAGTNLIGAVDYLEEFGSTGQTTGLYRTNGPFHDSISYASLLIPYLSFVYYWRQKKMIGSLTSFFSTLIIATGSFINFSRAAILGIFTTLTACYAKNVRFTLVVLFFSVIILAVAAPLLSDFISDLSSSSAFQERTSSGTMEHRWELYQNILTIVSENILIGIGYDNYVTVYGGGTHNSYLQVLIEEGIVGFCLFIMFIWNLCFKGLIRALKMRDKILTSVYIGICFVVLFIGNTITLLQSQNFFFALFIVLGTIHAYELNEKNIEHKKND